MESDMAVILITQDKEIWKPVVGFEGVYEVSSFGRVRGVRRTVEAWNGFAVAKKTIKERILTPTKNADGYRCFTLSHKNSAKPYRAARLVCSAFHGPCPEGLECAHLDGISQNDKADNLAWVSHSENCAHQKIHGTAYKKARGENHGASKLTNQQVKELRSDYERTLNYAATGRKFGISDSHARKIVKCQLWAHVL
jgi:NUMOD4 motif/HNH endonuclease